MVSLCSFQSLVRKFLVSFAGYTYKIIFLSIILLSPTHLYETVFLLLTDQHIGP